MVIVLPNRLHTHSLNKYLSSASYASSILLDVGNKEKKKKTKLLRTRNMEARMASGEVTFEWRST